MYALLALYISYSLLLSYNLSHFNITDFYFQYIALGADIFYRSEYKLQEIYYADLRYILFIINQKMLHILIHYFKKILYVAKFEKRCMQ